MKIFGINTRNRQGLVNMAVEVALADELDDVDSSLSTQSSRQNRMDWLDHMLSPQEKANVLDSVERKLKQSSHYASGIPYRYTEISHYE